MEQDELLFGVIHDAVMAEPWRIAARVTKRSGYNDRPPSGWIGKRLSWGWYALKRQNVDVLGEGVGLTGGAYDTAKHRLAERGLWVRKYTVLKGGKVQNDYCRTHIFPEEGSASCYRVFLGNVPRINYSDLTESARSVYSRSVFSPTGKTFDAIPDRVYYLVTEEGALFDERAYVSGRFTNDLRRKAQARGIYGLKVVSLPVVLGSGTLELEMEDA
jgi:hypothetical protein